MPALPMPDVSPAGEQHDIGHGRQHVVVTEVGATLRSYTVDGAPVIDGFGVTDMCSSGRGQVLAPWPNRLGDGRYSISPPIRGGSSSCSSTASAVRAWS